MSDVLTYACGAGPTSLTPGKPPRWRLVSCSAPRSGPIEKPPWGPSEDSSGLGQRGQRPLEGWAADVHTATSQPGVPGVVVRLRRQHHLLAALQPGPDERGEPFVADGPGEVDQAHVGLTEAGGRPARPGERAAYFLSCGTEAATSGGHRAAGRRRSWCGPGAPGWVPQPCPPSRWGYPCWRWSWPAGPRRRCSPPSGRSPACTAPTVPTGCAPGPWPRWRWGSSLRSRSGAPAAWFWSTGGGWRRSRRSR